MLITPQNFSGNKKLNDATHNWKSDLSDKEILERSQKMTPYPSFPHSKTMNGGRRMECMDEP